MLTQEEKEIAANLELLGVKNLKKRLHARGKTQ
jgi:hypothetical protein